MTFPRIGAAMLAGMLALLFGSAAARASGQSEALATVRQFIDSFNKGDVKTALATCAGIASIIDEFPPHEWQGQGACATWVAAYGADAQKNGITDGVVTLGTPWHVDVTGDRAYVVAPASYTYRQHGKAVTETDSVLAVALHETAGGWRITGWAWAKH